MYLFWEIKYRNTNVGFGSIQLETISQKITTYSTSYQLGSIELELISLASQAEPPLEHNHLKNTPRYGNNKANILCTMRHVMHRGETISWPTLATEKKDEYDLKHTHFVKALLKYSFLRSSGQLDLMKMETEMVWGLAWFDSLFFTIKLSVKWHINIIPKYLNTTNHISCIEKIQKSCKNSMFLKKSIWTKETLRVDP
jgi:hypothetical protein